MLLVSGEISANLTKSYKICILAYALINQQDLVTATYHATDERKERVGNSEGNQITVGHDFVFMPGKNGFK